MCNSSNTKPAVASASSYRGWETLALTNGLVELQVAPQLGGRVLQLKLRDYEYLWVNPTLVGEAPPAGGLGPEESWLNYGGDKLWPAPQGWEGEHQWAGPPSAVLDGGPHAATILASQGDHAAIRLTSGKDPVSGIQFSRTIAIYPDSTRVHFQSTMKNIDTRPRRWGIWQVTQHNAVQPSEGGYESNLYAYCPANPKSLFPQGYRVLYGDENNPSFSVDPIRQRVQVHFQYQVGKIGIDSIAGWLAVVHAATGHVFVTRFNVETENSYPEDSSVQFWINGAGKFHIGKTAYLQPDDPVLTPPYLESEVLSPFAELQPGESTQVEVDWYASRIAPHLPVLDCNDIGITSSPVVVTTQGEVLALTGNLGVFCTGQIGLVFRDNQGLTLEETGPMMPVSPAEAVCLALFPENVELPCRTHAVEIVLYNQAGKSLGLLAQSDCI